jgi:DNA mismatch repair protein MutS
MAGETMMTQYFKCCQEQQKKYGKNTIVMFQVGSFYEVYSEPNDNSTYIEEFAQICGMKIATKSSSHRMCGGPMYNVQTYIETMVDAGFTIAVYNQDTQKSGTSRSLFGVFSPGTMLKDDSKPDNSIVSIYVKQIQKSVFYRIPRIIFGVSIVNIHTGKSYHCEHNEEYKYSPITFDKIEQIISTTTPSELILLSDNFELDTKTFISFIGGESIDRVNRVELTKDNREITQQTYQHDILMKYHAPLDMNVFMEYTMLSHEPASCVAHCALLEFLNDHNPNLVSRLDVPMLYNGTQDGEVLLANHSLQQLNIISDGRTSGKLSSLVEWMDCCKTKMGSRLLRYSLVHPTSSIHTLEKEYDILKWIRENEVSDFLKVVNDVFMNIDVEKIRRKMVMKQGTVKDIERLVHAIEMMNSFNEKCNVSIKLRILEYCGIDVNTIQKVMGFLSDITCVIDMKSIDDEIFHRGVHPSLDDMVCRFKESHDKLNAIADYISSLIPEKKKTNLCKISSTEKSGKYLKLSKRRAGLLQDKLRKMPKDMIHISYVSSYDGTKKTMDISLEDLKFSKATTTEQRVDCSDIHDITRDEQTLKDIIDKERREKVEEFIQTIVPRDEIPTLINYLRNVDVLYSKLKVIETYGYTIPTLDMDADTSYCSFKSLRHPLIEQINQDERYIANDVELGRRLLFGTNAVGKSSLIKAIGISVILAQAGFGVPCSHMVYKPYRKIFTRIIGNDNIFKGLSTFQVEMSELMQIVKYGDERSLVLGDELCSGTEIDSAVSIFSAGLIELCSKSASFIFATHFHSVLYVPCISSLVDENQLMLNHLYVHYDPSLDALVYDRELREGTGTKSYGIEVCKSIGFPNEFINLATSIRKSIAKETLSPMDRTKSRYNAKKLKSNCELCGNKFDEIHHMEYQEMANDKGILPDGYTHKNHKANLMSICSKCHDRLHREQKVLRRKKTTKGFTFTELVKNYEP